MLMNTAFLLFEFLALISKVPYIQCKDEMQNVRENGFKIFDSKLPVTNLKRDTSQDSANFILGDGITVKEFVQPEKGFLAGEDTPVWLAEGHGAGKDVTYTKLPKGTVKKAVNYWQVLKKRGMPFKTQGGFSHKDTENVDFEFAKRASESFERKYVFPAPRGFTFTPGIRRGSVHRPSILAIVDFKTEWPSNELAEKFLIWKRVLYTLAFWNGVDLQLRHFKTYDASIHLRIAGIIITKNSGATPYNYETAMKYWVSMVSKNADFTEKAYDIAATLTDDGDKVNGQSFSADNGHYCNSYPPIFVLMAIDNKGFSGIPSAVHELVHLFGAPYNYVPFPYDASDAPCPKSENTVMAAYHSELGRKWTDCIARRVWSFMQGTGSCMSKPSEYHPPGNPVERILPGLFYRASAQCQAGGWEDGYVCWSYVTCSSLYCANNASTSLCRDYGPPQDGTTCGINKICLDGQCVNTPQFLLD